MPSRQTTGRTRGKNRHRSLKYHLRVDQATHGASTIYIKGKGGPAVPVCSRMWPAVLLPARACRFGYNAAWNKLLKRRTNSHPHFSFQRLPCSCRMLLAGPSFRCAFSSGLDRGFIYICIYISRRCIRGNIAFQSGYAVEENRQEIRGFAVALVWKLSYAEARAKRCRG